MAGSTGTRRSPYLTQAQAAALVRYSPEEFALSELLRQAEQSYKTGVATAHGGAVGTVAMLDRARPQVAQIYSDAGLQPGAAAQMPQLPSGALDFASAAKFEQSAAQHTLGQAQANALQSLADQRVSARAGDVFGQQQAQSQFVKDAGEVLRRKEALAREKGAFTAATAGDLQATADAQAARDRNAALGRRNARVIKGVDAQGNYLPGRAPKPKSKPRFTQSQRVGAARAIRSGLAALPDYGTPQALKSIRAATYLLHHDERIKDPFLAQVAAERYFYGGVTASTNRRLKQQYGITAKSLPPEKEAALSLGQALGSLSMPKLRAVG